MEQEVVTLAVSDPAAMAFDTLRNEVTGLRSEVTTLRLAVQQLAAAPSQIEIPDYTETLAEIRGAVVGLVSHYMKLRDAPALAVTPDQLAAQIKATSVEARKAESQSLKNAESNFVSITRELTGFVESARAADRQNKWLVGAFLLGIAISGTFAMAVTRWNKADPPATHEARQTVQNSR